MKNTVIKILLIIIILLNLSLIIINVKKQKHNINEINYKNIHPLSIELLRNNKYIASDLIIEKELKPGINYRQYIASYISDNLKIYSLLTIPNGEMPLSGWPVIIFNHGYIRPNIYETDKYYIPYINSVASNGYIVFHPDLRGHGNSEGKPNSQYFSIDYTNDIMNALETIKKYKFADANKIGMWGHSNGGNLILRILTLNKEIKASVIWGGVMAEYKDLTKDWQSKVVYKQPKYDLDIENNNLEDLLKTYNTPENNPEFWNSIDPMFYLSDINTPIQLHAGTKDEEVPFEFSKNLFNKMKGLNKTIEYYEYENGDHNISNPNYHLAMQRTVSFFNRYLK